MANGRVSVLQETTPPPAREPGLGLIIGRKIGLARLALAWEALWPRLLPLLAALVLFIAVAHFDVFAGLAPWVHTGILAGLALDRKSTRLNSSHVSESRMPSSA